MSYNIPKLDLDITGTNVNNRIIDEPHTLSGATYRSISPNLGPFFSETLQVKDGVTVLVRGMDYQVVELHQEATLLYGQEISSVILITRASVSSHVTITYQALGGHFAYSNNTIANVYEAVINDTRPIGWENIFNKPTEYPPSIHRHLLDDVFGFEPVVDGLERIKRAVTMGQTDVVLNIVNNLIGDIECSKLGKVFPVNKILNYDHFLYFVTQHKLTSPISVKSLECRYTKGSMFTIYIDNSQLPANTPVYWELYNPAGIIPAIRDTSGVVNATTHNYFNIYIPVDEAVPSILYLGVRLDPLKEDYDAVTYRLYADDGYSTSSNFGFLMQDFHIENALTTEDISTNEELRLFYGFCYYV